jgi:hypothetical protein
MQDIAKHYRDNHAGGNLISAVHDFVTALMHQDVKLFGVVL